MYLTCFEGYTIQQWDLNDTPFRPIALPLEDVPFMRSSLAIVAVFLVAGDILKKQIDV